MDHDLLRELAYRAGQLANARLSAKWRQIHQVFIDTFSPAFI